MKIATWNVNGIRAREIDMLAWLADARPDVVCLQEIKAPRDKVPAALLAHPDYLGVWHGERGYSGVALLVRRGCFALEPRFWHPDFDHDTRVAAATAGRLEVLSVYVPNGAKDLEQKLRFLRALAEFANDAHARGKDLVVCGDLNVTRSERDVHPDERDLTIGQLPVERELLAALLAQGLEDLGRALHPDDDALYTWWAPWRGHKQRNIGWRLDYVLAGAELAARARACEHQRLVGTSDHGPVVATFADDERGE